MSDKAELRRRIASGEEGTRPSTLARIGASTKASGVSKSMILVGVPLGSAALTLICFLLTHLIQTYDDQHNREADRLDKQIEILGTAAADIKAIKNTMEIEKVARDKQVDEIQARNDHQDTDLLNIRQNVQNIDKRTTCLEHRTICP